MGKVAIVILNYNGGQLLRDCVESFLGLTYPDYQIIVVDNASTDNSADGLEALGGKVAVIRSKDNLGYTGGNNLGMEYALAQGCDYVLLVNNDTLVVKPEFLSSMVEFAKTREEAGIVGPKVFFRREGVIQNTICATPFFHRALLNWPLQKLQLQKTKRSGEIMKEVDVLNGVCILLKGEMLREIGLLDPLIFMYREDTDIAIRARNAGWKSFYLPVESIVHLQKSEGYEYNSMVNFLLKRNAVYVLYKHGFVFSALGQGVSTLLLSIVRAVKATVRSQGKPYWNFVKVLCKAHWTVITGRNHNEAFGPPLQSWKNLLKK